MNIENIIRAWKADEDQWEAPLVASPIGQELTEEELLEVCGGDNCLITQCGVTCNITCNLSCGNTICGSTNGCSTTLHTL
jgi:hypothetical protein